MYLGKNVGSFARAMSGITYHSFCPECSDGGYIGNVSNIGSERKEVEEESAQEESEIVEQDEESESYSYQHSGSSAPASSSGSDGAGRVVLVVVALVVMGVIFASRPNDHHQSVAPPNSAQGTSTIPREPNYPIHKTIPMNQSGWSEVITLNPDERCFWRSLEDDVWVDTRVNQNEEFRQFPLNDS
jgi:hypothetical protein